MRLLHHGLSRQAQRRPAATAIVHGDRRLSFGELEERSNRLAHVLREAGCRPGDRVCLAIPKCPEAIVAILATLEAGAIYVPLDTSNPAPRAAKMTEACRPAALWTTREGFAFVDRVRAASPAARAAGVGLLDANAPGTDTRFGLRDLEAAPTSPLELGLDASRPAYIMFTSGSTGTPKGVVVTHANVLAFLDWAIPHFGLGSDDRVSGHPPLHFDLSVFDLFGAIHAGAELHLVPAGLSLHPHRLAAFIRDFRLTQWCSVPSLLGYLASFDAVRAGDFPELRRLLWCGEVLPTPALIYWMERLGHVTFTNLYGPTETTIASSAYTVRTVPRDPLAALPIGRACDGEQLLVLDDDLRPVPSGQTGDLYIGGAGVGLGYWEDPEKTARAFVPCPAGGVGRIYRTGDLASIDGAGLAWFHGRSDTQIKSRGYRIDLGEIEAALQLLDGVAEGAVVDVPTNGFESKAIGCVYTSAGGSTLTPADVRRKLSTRLPAYMLPSRWARLDALPRNANGKIDRNNLRELLARADDA